MLQSRDIGLRVDADGLRVPRLRRPRRELWHAVADDPLLRARALPDGLRLALRLEDRDVQLKPRAARDRARPDPAAGRSCRRPATSCRSTSVFARDGTDEQRRVSGTLEGKIELHDDAREQRRDDAAPLTPFAAPARVHADRSARGAGHRRARHDRARSRPSTQSARNGTYLRDKTLAHWIGMNVITERRLQPAAAGRRRIDGARRVRGPALAMDDEGHADAGREPAPHGRRRAPRRRRRTAPPLATVSGFYGTRDRWRGRRRRLPGPAGRARHATAATTARKTTSASAATAGRPKRPPQPPADARRPDRRMNDARLTHPHRRQRVPARRAASR